MENNLDNNSVDMSVEDAQSQAAFFYAMEKLEQDPNFQLVIQKGYLQDNAIRLVGLRGIPKDMGNDLNQDEILGDIDAIGRFQMWMKIQRDRTKIVADELQAYINAIDKETAEAELEAE